MTMNLSQYKQRLLEKLSELQGDTARLEAEARTAGDRESEIRPMPRPLHRPYRNHCGKTNWHRRRSSPFKMLCAVSKTALMANVPAAAARSNLPA